MLSGRFAEVKSRVSSDIISAKGDIDNTLYPSLMDVRLINNYSSSPNGVRMSSESIAIDSEALRARGIIVLELSN